MKIYINEGHNGIQISKGVSINSSGFEHFHSGSYHPDKTTFPLFFSNELWVDTSIYNKHLNKLIELRTKK